MKSVNASFSDNVRFSIFLSFTVWAKLSSPRSSQLLVLIVTGLYTDPGQQVEKNSLK